MNPTAPFRVGDTNHHNVVDVRVLHKDVFHVHGEHVFTAGNNHIAAPVGEVQIALIVYVAHIAHAAESTAHVCQLFPADVFRLEITAGGGHENFAHFAGRQLCAVFRPHGNFAAAEGPAHAAGVLQPFIAANGGDTNHFAHGVDFIDIFGTQNVNPCSFQLCGAVAAGVRQRFHALEVIGVEGIQLQHTVHQCGHHLDTFDFVVLDVPLNGSGLEVVGHHNAVAAAQTGNQCGGGCAVEHRSADQLTAAEEHTGHIEPCHQTFVGFSGGAGEANQFRLAGGAAGGLCPVGIGQNIGGHFVGISVEPLHQSFHGHALDAFRLISLGNQQIGFCQSHEVVDFPVCGAGGNGQIAGAVFPSCVNAENMSNGVGQANHDRAGIGNALFLEQPCQLVGFQIQVFPSGCFDFRIVLGNFNHSNFVGLGLGNALNLAAYGNEGRLKLYIIVVVDVEVFQLLHIGNPRNFLFLFHN